jgi:flavin reductase (DIM6/NTAB) family NADH-FMN oxidoreductase RutF
MKKRIGPKTLLYPMPAVLIGSIVEGKPNFMTAAWCGIAAQKPPSIAVAIQKSRHTLKGIEEKKCFSVNVPNSSLVEKVDFCGTHSGAKHDKSEVFKVFFGTLKDAPMIEECPVNMECKVAKSVDVGSHMLVIGEIVETFINEDCLKEGKPDPRKIDPLVYTTGVRKYAVLGEYIADAFSIGKKDE